jgi:hypothetical protein
MRPEQPEADRKQPETLETAGDAGNDRKFAGKTKNA